MPDFIVQNLAIALALSASFMFAVSVQLTNLGLKHADPTVGVTIQIAVIALIYWGLAPFYLELTWLLTSATLIFGLVGIFRPLISSNLSINGVRLLGPTLSSALASTSPFWGAFFGVVFLSEVVTWPLAFGIGAIAAGLITQAFRRQETKLSGWPLWALLLPLGAAFFRALGHLFIKLGYDEVASPYYAALVSSTVSCLIALAIFRARGHKLQVRNAGTIWYVLSGALNAVAALAINNALMHGQIIEVVPLVSITPAITLLLTLFVFRREEITLQKVITVALVFVGVVVITTSN